jgi:hypothetical protein
MDIKEIKIEKDYLEIKIAGFITDFEEKTGTKVGPLKIVRGQDEARPGNITINLQVTIP